MPRLLSSRPKEFKLFAPQAKKVILSGSFNNWSQGGPNAKKDSKGNWSVRVSLKPGKYEYKFFVDGAWVNDPGCKSCVPNPFGSHNCVVVVK